MDIEFDPTKDAANIARRGLSLADFAGFDADPVVIVDDRFRLRRSALPRLRLDRWRRSHDRLHHARQDDAPDQFPPRPRQGDAPL